MNNDKKLFRILLLPTSKVELNGKQIYKSGKKLHIPFTGAEARRISHEGVYMPQHLFIISDDKISYSDWVYCTLTKEVYQVFGCSQESQKKIISSTDKSITPDSWIPDSYVSWFVLKANDSGVPVDYVKLEMLTTTHGSSKEELIDNTKLVVPKTNDDGSIVVCDDYVNTKVFTAKDEIERLKTIWKFLNSLLEKEDFNSANNFINCFITDTMDVSSLRTLVDATQMYSDRKEILDKRVELIELIESKIGKIH